MKRRTTTVSAIILLLVGFMTFPAHLQAETVDDFSLLPPFVNAGVPPLVMLTMARNHKLYYEAYNDISDLDNDGVIDVGYKGYMIDAGGNANPAAIDYYGYFDSFKCYSYDSSNRVFNPVKVTTDKVCNTAATAVSARTWSGDFLNYVTMSRMDTLRKVLFGGYRSTDSTTATVLERVFIPQDAHTWGKEYGTYLDSGGNPVVPDYNITDFTPLDTPATGMRHLIANTSLGVNSPPVMRVMPNNSHRIWEWVAKERPVADNSLEDLSGGGGSWPSHMNNAGEFDAAILSFANASHLEGSGSMSRMQGSGNPYTGLQDYFITVMTGTLNVPLAQGGVYEIGIDGDDTVEVWIDGVRTTAWYGGHGTAGSPQNAVTVTLAGGDHAVEFRHHELTGGDGYILWWKGAASSNSWEVIPDSRWPAGVTRTIYNTDIGVRPVSAITDYEVRVKVCDASMPELNCKQYGSGIYKPVGLLQKHGENESMYFGLMTGSYTKNTSGGVLRKNVGSIRDEINLTTGQFSNVNGIISTINKMKIVGFDYGSFSYNQNCGWITTRPIAEGECRMWGNPVGEMMYETLRYFAGKSGPTSAFTYGTSSSYDDNILGLPKPSWQNPYDATNGFPECARPFMLVLSDPNTNFDSDQIPGSYFNSVSGDLTGLDAEVLADKISVAEGINGNYFIGQSGNTYDGAPTEKTVTSLGNIRGLSPEEPTKQGSFYAGSVAWYGHTTDLNAAASEQKVSTFSVALSSPLPRIEIDTDQDGDFDVTVVPFAKSVGGCLGVVGTQGLFQPTNTIVDVFMQQLSPTYGKFRINYEDVEQGADHDMDAIATYEYTVNNDGTVTIDISSDYASGCIQQHMGFVISGTTADGTYLEVRDVDTASGSDPDYFLDTPPGETPGGNWNDSTALPLTSSRTFSVSNSGSAATILKDPLWYAAKYGGFEEKSAQTDAGWNYPDLQAEWDEGPGSPDGDPDTYFYVTNPLYLEQQLARSFAEILRRTSSGTAASVISSSRSGEGAIYQSLFYTTLTDTAGRSIDWAGQTHALFIDSYGNMREDSDASGALSMTDDKIIMFVETNSGGNIKTVISRFTDSNGDGRLTGTELSATDSNVAVADINCVWNSSAWLNELPDANILTNRSSYISSGQQRYIFTLIDADNDMVADPGETKAFVDSDSSILPYIHALQPFDNTLLPSDLSNILSSNPSAYAGTILPDFQTQQRKRVIKFIRGQDQGSYNSSTSPSYSIPPLRSRQIDYDDDGTTETWRMGDIVYSSPTIVGPPVEDYDLLYHDSSYIGFYLKYFNRRNVVYVGANDGMLHAFNAGFYDRGYKTFYKNYFLDTSNNNMPTFDNAAGPDLGAELWGYVPFNLLPHLYWLADGRYNTEKHVAFMDLKPRIFDAKIFTPDTTHINGWGTLMVVGMRFGGGAFQIDSNMDNLRTDAAGNPEKVMRSALVVLDITDPEVPPTVLAELSFADLGFTTAYPTVAVFRDRGDLIPAPSSPSNEWYLALGSGPFDSTLGGPRGDALTDATSNQAAKVYLVDLKVLAQNGSVSVIDSNGSAVTGGSIAPFASVDSNAFVSDLVAVDYDLDYRPDTIYFGTVSGSFATGWGGKMRRLLFKDNPTRSTWIGDSTLIDLGSVESGQPITAAATISISPNALTNDRWIYFGTGRFFNRKDVNNLATAGDVQSYYGIKEPLDVSNSPPTFTWGTVTNSTLLDTTAAKVFEDGITVYTVYPNTTTKTAFNLLVERMKIQDPSATGFVNGWRFNLTDARERNLGQAVALGEILTFSTYVPSLDACEIEGNSNLYAIYYTTGTAYKKHIFNLIGTIGVTEDRDGDGFNETTSYEVLRKKSIGRGMTLTPNLHVGRNKGSKAFLQTSTGGIIGFEQKAPGFTKSGVISWQDEN